MKSETFKIELKRRHYVRGGKIVNFTDIDSCPLSNAVEEALSKEKCIAYVHTVVVFNKSEREVLHVNGGGSMILGSPGYTYSDYWEDLRHIEDRREEEVIRTILLVKSPEIPAGIAPEDKLKVGELQHV